MWELFAGEVSFGTNDADESPFNFQVTGETTAPPAVQIVDNGDTDFQTIGEWRRWTGQGFESDIHESVPGTAADVATWSFANLPVGTYRVAATWRHFGNRASDSPFHVLDQDVMLDTVRVNQQIALRF